VPGFGLERSKERDGESLPASWDGTPPGAVKGGCGGGTRTPGPRRLREGSEVADGGYGRGARSGGACRCGRPFGWGVKARVP